MKIGVKLHRLKAKGPMDTYQIQRSPFAPTYRQACQILQAIRLYNHRPSQACLVHLATYVTRSWESDSSTDKVNDIYEFINQLMDTTSLNRGSLSLDGSIQHYCSKDMAVPTVCPGITLLFAMRYIERLKKSYGNVKGTNGCCRRVILVAYIIAAKYIHSNLKFIVDTSLPLEKESSSLPALPLTKPVSQSPSQLSSHLTLPPDKLLSTALPISPPVSPKQPELTDPTQYHYFQSTKSTSCDSHGFSPKVRTHLNTTSAVSDSMPSISSMCSQFNYRVWRMENEFLHFLNGDIRVPDCLRLVDWANQIVSTTT